MTRVPILTACFAAAVVFLVGVVLADSPVPTEEQIQAKLLEVRKRVETAQAAEHALQKQLEDAQQTPRGQITAEVEGVLCWRKKGGGYYIRIRQGSDPKQETRVWLVYGEDKISGRNLEMLMGQDVVAKGRLLQQPIGTQGHVPPSGMFMETPQVTEALKRPHK